MNPIALELKDVVGRSNIGELGADRPLNLAIRAGEVGVIIGGKETSSLFRLIMGLGKIDSGAVMIYDQVAFDCNSDETDLQMLRKRVGFGFRDKGLLSNISVRDNVSLPAKYHGHHQAGETPNSLGEKALNELGVDPKVWDYRPSRISYEERKKVLLARAIVLNPRILILDDPPALAASTFLPVILRWIKSQQAKGRAILIGTNDLPFGLAAADWVLHPTKKIPVTTYDDFIDQAWIASAKILTERMQRP